MTFFSHFFFLLSCLVTLFLRYFFLFLFFLTVVIICLLSCDSVSALLESSLTFAFTHTASRSHSFSNTVSFASLLHLTIVCFFHPFHTQSMIYRWYNCVLTCSLQCHRKQVHQVQKAIVAENNGGDSGARNDCGEALAVMMAVP